MHNVKSRLHMHNHTEPNGTAYIIGERQALKILGQSLIKASKSVLGLENVEFYTSDGHKYELVITCDISENEWQNLPVPYSKEHNPEVLEIVQSYKELKVSSQ